ncbi:MAG: pyruvate kinase, partial [Bacteroidetes bacterium]|nr:pyruvate kinase [Bacteroidota bacterium]
MRKTKIVATISGNNCSEEFIRSLFDAGMNVVRINSAHASIEESDILVDNVRKVSEKIAILIDTKGPEIRTTKCAEDEGISVEVGDRIVVRGGELDDISTREVVYLNEKNITKNITIGDVLLIDDGDIKLDVVDKKGDDIVVEVANSGFIKSRKSVNIPNVDIPLPSISEKDERFIRWAAGKDLDFVAHSFVRTKEDVIAVQDIIDECDSPMKIISKIENQQGVDNISEILEYTYGVMVARGDLGVEIPAEQIPVIQRDLVRKCVERKKPVIIATQMLQSMINNPRPTRAEIGDIANAIFQRADAIMLSGETANGKYPVESVTTMDTVALEIEKNTAPIVDINMVKINNEITAQLARSAVKACVTLPVEAIIIDTFTGRTARYLSAFRGEKIVYAVCYKKTMMRQLALSYGIFAEYHEQIHPHSDFLPIVLEKLEKAGRIRKHDLIVVVGGD